LGHQMRCNPGEVIPPAPQRKRVDDMHPLYTGGVTAPAGPRSYVPNPDSPDG
jgi:hypothetical protein